MASPRFGRRFNNRQDQGGGGTDEELEQEEVDAPCFLEVYVHDTCNIHNIYANQKNQDVYAKFSLTSAPDHAPALSTRVAAGPCFDERLPPLRVRRGRLAVDVLKCELWMRRPLLLEDQLLGFALVPLASVAAADGARLAAREFELSSTDLLHSPAGTVRLSLDLHSGSLPGHDGDAYACPPPLVTTEPSIASEVVILNPAPPPPPVTDYRRIEEFPDLNAVKENHDMAVQYLPFQHLGDARSPPESEAVMVMEGEEEEGDEPASSSSDSGSKNASTTTTASDSRAVKGTKPDAHESTAAAAAPMSCRSPETPTSSSGNEKGGKETNKGDVFTSPLGGIDDMDVDEQSEMQRQIIEMYVRSMQQFSESIAKMNMPIVEVDGVVVHKEKKPENDGAARVFYGSRAFF